MNTIQENDHPGGHPRATSSTAGRWEVPGVQAMLSQALSQMTEHKNLEACKPLIFRNPISGFCLKNANVRQEPERERDPWGGEYTPLYEGEDEDARRNSPGECSPGPERYGDRETALSTTAGPWWHASAKADCGEPLAGDSGQARGAPASATSDTTPAAYRPWWPNSHRTGT